MRRLDLAVAFVAVLAMATQVRADLVLMGSFTGSVDLSTDGLGTHSGSGNLQAELPQNSSILAAFLLAQPPGLQNWTSSPNITFAGTTRKDATLLDSGNSALFDVTSEVQGAYNQALTLQNFSMVENTELEGSTLAVVYSHDSLSDRAVVLYGGGFANGVHNFTANLPVGVGLNEPVSLSLGIDFSFTPSLSQRSRVDVNASRLTSDAGGHDDGEGSNGALLTTGGVGDSLNNPSDPNAVGAGDDELYNLNPFLSNGDNSIDFRFEVPGGDRVHFIGISYQAQPVLAAVPEPGSLAIWSLGALGMGVVARRRAKRKQAS